MSAIVNFVKDHPKTTARDISNELHLEKSFCNRILYAMLKKKILKSETEEGKSTPLWSIDSLEPFQPMQEVLSVLSKDFIQTKKIVEMTGKEKSEVNSLLYSLMTMGFVELRKNEKGGNPEWKLI